MVLWRWRWVRGRVCCGGGGCGCPFCSWFENVTFHVGELWGLSAVIEFYYGLEQNDDAAYQLRVPRATNAQAELRAFRPQARGLKLAHKLTTLMSSMPSMDKVLAPSAAGLMAYLAKHA